MRALITGAAGFVGGHLAALAADRGAEVVGPSREELDLLDADAVRGLVADVRPDAVFHLAALASVGESWRAPAETLDNNLRATLNLLEAVRGETPEAVVVVVGSGVAGISAASQIKTRCPGLTFAVLEGRHELGGTWSIHNYPGVRCDSDMYTLSFRFHPWTQPRSIADGPSILQYLRTAAERSGVDRHVRYGHRVTGANWSSTSSTFWPDARDRR